MRENHPVLGDLLGLLPEDLFINLKAPEVNSLLKLTADARVEPRKSLPEAGRDNASRMSRGRISNGIRRTWVPFIKPANLLLARKERLS